MQIKLPEHNIVHIALWGITIMQPWIIASVFGTGGQEL